MRRNIHLSVVPLGMVMLVVMFCYSGVSSFITLFAETRNLTAAASVYFVVYAVVVLISRPIVGRHADRKGENRVVYPALVVLATGYVVLAFSFAPAPLLVSAALIGFGVGSTQSIIQSTAVKLVEPKDLGRANSTLFMHMDLGTGIGPVAIGAVLPFINYQGCYLVLAVGALLALTLYFIVHGRKH